MERSANLNPASSQQPTGPVRGVIHQLIHLSAGSDVPTTHLVSAHNGVGYGYIRTPGGDVFFDAAGITDLRFDQLKRTMTVEFVLDQAAYLRASRLTVFENEPGVHPE